MNISIIILTLILSKILYLKNRLNKINKSIIDKNNKLEKKIYLIASKIYFHNKYKIKKISQDYKIKKFYNMYIICSSNNKTNCNNIKIELPKIKKSDYGSKIYIKNNTNKNILLCSNNIFEYNNLSVINENIIIRPLSMIKIFSLNNNIYLINKI